MLKVYDARHMLLDFKRKQLTFSEMKGSSMVPWVVSNFWGLFQGMDQQVAQVSGDNRYFFLCLTTNDVVCSSYSTYVDLSPLLTRVRDSIHDS